MLPEIKNILYTTDLGEHTRPVMRHAVSIAKHFDAKITLLHVLEPLGSFGKALIETYVSADASDKMHEEAVRGVQEKIKERLVKFCEEELQSVSISSAMVKDILVLEGQPARTIVECAETLKADLIVMGTHNYSTIGEMLIGSTARRVTQLASMPVFIVPMHAAK